MHMNRLSYRNWKALLLPFFLPALTLAQSKGIDSTFDNQHYRARLEFFKAMPNQKDEIVFLGNSITEGGKWQEILQRKHVINRGISGDVTYGILARLDEILASRPRKIFLLCGVNDMKRGIPLSIISTNIERIIKQVKKQSPNTALFVQGLLPVNDKIVLLNKALKELCTAHQVRFVDLQPILADGNGELKAELTIDGLHLKQASYLIWANYLKQQKLL